VTQIGRITLVVATLAALLAGCGSTGPTAQNVVDALGPLFPVGNQRDNTGTCEPTGCEQLITTDAVSVYQWPDEAAAVSFATGLGDVVQQVGPFVLSYAGTEQQLTPRGARAAFAARVRTLLDS
jgi:hypothetical protein